MYRTRGTERIQNQRKTGQLPHPPPSTTSLLSFCCRSFFVRPCVNPADIGRWRRKWAPIISSHHKPSTRMGGIELDLKEYEDPAPKNLDSDLAGNGPTDEVPDSPPVNKKKLPFRAEINAKGRRYKGKRSSRADLELDTETLGLLNDSEGGESDKDSISVDDDLSPRRYNGLVDEDDDMQLDADSGDEEGNEDEQEDDYSEIEDDLDDGSLIRAEELKKDERATVQRLVKAEEDDLRRARAVKKQRELYDSVVNMRIKLEPLLSLARTFPNLEQRKQASTWEDSEELLKALSATESALASLSSQAEKAFLLSWPSEGHEENPEEFTAWRNEIIDEWGKRVNEAEGVVPKGGFKAIDTSVTAQMKAALASGKHLNRSRRVREPIDLVGDIELKQGTHEMQYDDGEFYRTLLRDIIESGDAAGGGLRYAQLSKGGRIKKKRDTSYAKGKRLKYNVHEKLVGFLTPMPMPDPGPVDEIVAALFGRMGTVVTE